MSQEEIIKRIIDAVTESGVVGYTAHLSEEEIYYLRLALKDIAEKTVKRIFLEDMMSGVDLSRVVDVCSVAPTTDMEVIHAVAG